MRPEANPKEKGTAVESINAYDINNNLLGKCIVIFLSEFYHTKLSL